MNGGIYVVSGPSGVGKSSIIREVMALLEGLAYSVSHTSRKPRPGEMDGREYHFVGRDDFRRMIGQGGFAEWAEVYGDYYGTSILEVEQKIERGLDLIMDVDVQGAANIRSRFRDCVLIFVLPPSMDVLAGRLKGRGADDEASMTRRLEKAAREMENASWYDYIIINQELNRASDELASIVKAERCRSSRRIHLLSGILPPRNP
ncbi:MAG: guanylate kinase [Desulfobacteraceae bacterium]